MDLGPFVRKIFRHSEDLGTDEDHHTMHRFVSLIAIFLIVSALALARYHPVLTIALLAFAILLVVLVHALTNAMRRERGARM